MLVQKSNRQTALCGPNQICLRSELWPQVASCCLWSQLTLLTVFKACATDQSRNLRAGPFFLLNLACQPRPLAFKISPTLGVGRGIFLPLTMWNLGDMCVWERKRDFKRIGVETLQCVITLEGKIKEKSYPSGGIKNQKASLVVILSQSIKIYFTKRINI